MTELDNTRTQILEALGRWTAQGKWLPDEVTVRVKGHEVVLTMVHGAGSDKAGCARSWPGGDRLIAPLADRLVQYVVHAFRSHPDYRAD